MRDSTSLPDLKVLPTESLIPHEDIDPRRVERLSRRIHKEGRLKNPPVVAPIPDTDQYVILDGANRSLAFGKLGIPHIVVQLVSYGDPGVTLDTWYHVVSGMDIELFESALQQVTGLHLVDCTLMEARASLSTNRAAAYIVRKSQVRMVCNSADRQLNDLGILRGIVDAYRGRADIYRASNDIWEIQSPYYPEITALVIFPQLKPSDIIEAVRSGEKVPTGITRHIISPRALNINIPLKILSAEWSYQRKKEWLEEWLMQRMAANAIRYYAEATFSFDE
jgi:hypothetical protein